MFAKDVMQAAGVPTAERGRFTDADEAPRLRAARRARPSSSRPTASPRARASRLQRRSSQAEAAIRQSLLDKVFGDAGNRVLVEECLRGEEASILALVDGETRRHAGVLAGPQARPRQRRGPEHGRHGRLLAGAV